MNEPQHLRFKGFLSFLILHELSKKSHSGQDLAERIGRKKQGKLTPGTIYPTLKKLRLQKLIRYRRYGRDKRYFLTDIGKQELDLCYLAFSKYFYGLKKHIKRTAKNI